MTKGSDIYRQRRKQRPKRKRLSLKLIPVAVIAVLVVLFSIGGSRQSRVSLPAEIEAQRLMAVEMPDETPEVKVSYEGFDVSFNPVHHLPNYVVWELTEEESKGTERRNSRFRSDPDVLGCATNDDYRNSGFDRGHMAPAGDMKWSSAAMADSHYFTNICPQTRQLNGGRWSTLEKKCREWVVRDSALIIICGPVLTDELTRYIGAGVSVPERYFKVIMAPYANPPRAIGFVMPNSEQVDGLENLAMSVDDVEAITGYDFFACLPEETEDKMESHANFRDWNRRKR